MKQLIGLYKRRRKTFKRRFTAIMKKVNPRISVYLSFGSMGFGAGKKKDNNELTEMTPFEEQLAILRRILLKREQFYDRSVDIEKEAQHQALNIKSYK